MSRVFTAKSLTLTSDGQFVLAEDSASGGTVSFNPTIYLRPDEVVVGCTSVSRDVVERLYKLFEMRFPSKSPTEIKVQ